MAGHLFIVHGDLTAIACDAIFVPTDSSFTFTESWDSLELVRPSEGWAGRKVIRYRAKPGEPELWLGEIGRPGHDNVFADFEPAITDFVTCAAMGIPMSREGRICAWPKLRLALNVVGSGQGGARHNKGGLIKGLVALLRSLAAEHNVDIIFATFSEKTYAAAQLARRKILTYRSDQPRRELTKEDLKTEWKFADFTPPELVDKAMHLAEIAKEDQLVLFIGAGSSADAGVPTWKQLLREVAEGNGIGEDYLELLKDRDLRDWATLIDRKLAVGKNIHELVAVELAQHQYYSLQHALLASLPSSEAVTTNFDQLFELASRVGDRDLSVLPIHPNRSTSAWLLKLHGSVEDPTKLVLTRSDYLNMPRNRGALMGLVQGLLLTRHMLYVGYSLSDEDFHELVHEVRAAVGDGSGGRPATLIALATDETQRDLWRDELDIVSMGLKPADEPGERLKEAARQVDIFLDLVGFWSATSAPFLLDRDYIGLSDDDERLRNSLSDLATVVGSVAGNAAENQVRKFLHQLGLPGSEQEPSYTERVTPSDLRDGRIRIRDERLRRLSGEMDVDLRGVLVRAGWRRSDGDGRCGVLHFRKGVLTSLVEPGERLKIRDDGTVHLD